MIALTVILVCGGFTNQAKARDQGRHNGLLMDPLLIEEGYISGTVFGDPEDSVHIYRGIPYAAPPVKDLRWRPPQPPAPWSGIRECVDYSIHPVQFMPGRYYPVDDPQSEDSLYLNVLTPARHTNEKLPVMVWFHGGGLSGASGNDVTWNNYRLPQHGVVLVTVNTRLGALGFLAHPKLTAESPNGVSGNYMFLDMIASLKWVQKNIDSFGGNPDNITIFGESGGGAKVTCLLASPLAKGLFHKAIVQSGGYIIPEPLSNVEAWGEKFFKSLGVTTLAEARSKSWQDIVAAYVAMRKTPSPFPHAPEFGPAVDGWFLKDTARGTYSAGNQNAVPIIVQAVLGELPVPRFMPEMIDHYRDMLNGNLNLGIRGYAAIFNQVPANWKANGIKSFHALDLSYTFGFYDDPYADMWIQMTRRTKPRPPQVGEAQDAPELGEKDKAVSETMMTMFTQFAKTGNPNIPGKAKRSVYWPTWSPYGDEYINWDNGSQIKSGFSELQ